MILYIREDKDVIHYYGYASYEPKMLKSAGFRDSVCTDYGYTDKTALKASEALITRVAPAIYFAGSVVGTDNALSKLKSLPYELDKVFVPDSGKLSYYIKFGSSFDGLKDDDMSDVEYCKLLKSKLTTYTEEVMSRTVIEELRMMFAKEKKDRHWEFNDIKYWDPPVKKPTFLTGNKILYFPNLKKYKDKHLYLATNVKETDEIGKQMKSINYTIMLCNDIEEVTALVKKLDTTLSQPIVIKTDVLYNKSVLRNMKYGSLVLNRYCGVIEVAAPNGEVLALLYSPPGLMMILRDDIRATLSVFEKSDSKIITESIYRDGKIIPDLGNKFVLDEEINGAKIKLYSGIDTLDRNLFKRLEKKKPSVSLFHISSEKLTRYYTSIEIEDAIAISYAPFNNLSFKK